MTGTKRKNLILTAIFGAVFALLIVIGGVGIKVFGAAEKQIVADYTVTAGETTVIADLIDFDEDGVTLTDVSVRFLGNNSEIETENGEFTPEKPGMYKVTLVKTKNGASISSYYHIKAVASDSAIIKRSPLFPYAFVSGQEYKIDLPVAYLYNDDGTRTETSSAVKVTVNGETVELQDNKITPVVTRSGDKALVEYTVAGKTEASNRTLSYEIPVMITISDSGVLDMTQLFVAEKTDAIKTESSYLTVYTSVTGSEIKFINPIPADNFRLRWKMNEGKTNFDEFIVCLEDYKNPDERVEIAYSSGGTSGAKVSVSGSNPYTVKSVFGSGSFTLDYSVSKKSISDENGIIAYVTSFANGRKFTGFGSGIVKVSVRFGEVRSYSAVSLSHIGNQPLSGVRKDSISPYVFFEDEVRLRYEQGETIKINKAVAYDVLDPNATVSVNVYKLNADDTISAEIPVDGNGNELRNYDCSQDVYIKVDEICRFRVEYTARDWNNRRTPVTYIYVVGDNQNPTVEFGTMVEKAKVGDTITLPEITYDDNSGKDNVSVLMTYLTPSNVLEVVKNTNTFTASQKGTYKVKIMVYDKQYNYVYKEYVVEVTE